MVVLDKIRIYAASGKLLGMPCFHKKAAIVTEYIRFDNYDIRDGSRDKFHIYSKELGVFSFLCPESSSCYLKGREAGEIFHSLYAI